MDLLCTSWPLKLELLLWAWMQLLNSLSPLFLLPQLSSQHPRRSQQLFRFLHWSSPVCRLPSIWKLNWCFHNFVVDITYPQHTRKNDGNCSSRLLWGEWTRCDSKQFWSNLCTIFCRPWHNQSFIIKIFFSDSSSSREEEVSKTPMKLLMSWNHDFLMAFWWTVHQNP